MKRRWYMLGVLAMLAVSGCAFKEAAPMQTYTLENIKVTPVRSSSYRHKILKIAYPQTLKEKMTDRICYSYDENDRGEYLNSVWSNALEKLLQGSIIDILQQSHIFKAVVPYASSVNADYRLEILIYDLSHHIRGKDSYAVVSVQMTLIDSSTGVLVKSRRFAYRETTQSVDAKGYVAATNKIMHRFASDLLLWLK